MTLMRLRFDYSQEYPRLRMAAAPRGGRGGDSGGDKLVKDGRMPQAREIDGRVLWDSEEIRAAWRSIPKRGQVVAGNSWEDAA